MEKEVIVTVLTDVENLIKKGKLKIALRLLTNLREEITK